MFPKSVTSLFYLLIIVFTSSIWGKPSMNQIEKLTVQKTIQHLKNSHPESEYDRIKTGVKQAASLWNQHDGENDAFIEFCEAQFISDPVILKETFVRFQDHLESLEGHFLEMSRDMADPVQLEIGDVLPVDRLFAEYSPDAHVMEDLFQNKIAFVALLNFPFQSLNEKLQSGEKWSRNEWAEAKLGEYFINRVPAEVKQEINRTYVKADDYIANYNIHMHHVLDKEGKRLFPEGLKLITHWNLRDELKAQYANKDGLSRQKMIHEIMGKIILQDIPQIVIDNPEVDWQLSTNHVFQYSKNDPLSDKLSHHREPDTRYQYLLDVFHAENSADPYYPAMPTHMDRKFQRDRQIPEEQVEAFFHEICSSDEVKETALLIQKRLGRPLLPFDIWYSGFKAKGKHSEKELDKIVRSKYPDVAHFEKDIPRILSNLGFDNETAEFLSSKIIVDPARGAGHALGAERKEDNAHLRTRIPSNGMNYKGYNIAIHELGHNVEQVLSLNRIDHNLLQGVPNNGFTEAFAFVFQSRDMELLGIKEKDENAEYLKSLAVLWSTYEIAGVSLVDMHVWRWMYDHPDANAADLKQAVINIAKDVWNTYYAPVFGMKDEILLGIYSHMIVYSLYLPDYPLGHIIMFQIEQYLKDKLPGEEMERMCTLGNITPDAWMRSAVGEPLSVQPLLKAAREALDAIR